ncbi:MAG: hypothetical protein K0S47_1697 [Herbinix sp.]|jgi:D-alanyl-D-alanine carboxypeptidase|nr:hypothetical protein [Herbinix sp.]
MKIKIIRIIIPTLLLLNGCQKSTETFLPYYESQSVINYDTGFYINADNNDFYGKNLAIVKNENNVGGDNTLTSKAVLSVDTITNEIVYADHVYDRLYPASLTKLATALVVLKNAELTDSVTISYNASHITEPGAKLCGWKEGDVVTMDVLLHSLLIYSGNDAALAIAEHVGGSEAAFAEMMNDEVRKVGATESNFINPHGLHDENHYTTAYDLYLIFNELIKYDTFRSIIELKEYTATYRTQDGIDQTKSFQTTNQYLTGTVDIPLNIQVLGGKTGTTSKAGNCLILLSKNQEDHDCISVILNAEDSSSLYSQMSHLLLKENVE